MPKEQKGAVLEYLFDLRWDEGAKSLSDPLVTIKQVGDALEICNVKYGNTLSTNNPANFLKDYSRNRSNAEKKFPARIKEAGFTVEQLTGKGRCFKFVPLADEAAAFLVLGDLKTAEHLQVQSLSMPLASKSLGRSDEAWLTQVAVKLNFIESYFALSTTGRNIIEIDHLQMNAKLGRSEIDSIYRYIEVIDGAEQQGLILLEAKGKTEDVSHDQIVSSLKAGKTLLSGDVKYLMPMALKVVAKGAVHILEFEVFGIDDISGRINLPIAHQAVIEISPPVKGI